MEYTSQSDIIREIELLKQNVFGNTLLIKVIGLAVLFLFADRFRIQ